MGWEEQIFALLDDLEGQADAAFGVERDQEIADRGQAEYAQVTLASRLMATVDQQVRLEVLGVGVVEGLLQRVAAHWCLVAGAGQEWIVRLPTVASVQGASPRSVPEVAWSPVARLGFGSALRRLVEAREPCVLRLLDGTRQDVRAKRVGADFVEVRLGRSVDVLVPFTAISAVQRRD